MIAQIIGLNTQINRPRSTESQALHPPEMTTVMISDFVDGLNKQPGVFHDGILWREPFPDCSRGDDSFVSQTYTFHERGIKSRGKFLLEGGDGQKPSCMDIRKGAVGRFVRGKTHELS